MENLTQIELQNLKNLIDQHETLYKKLNIYQTQVEDSQVKQIFTKAAQNSLNIKQKLISFLNG